MDDRDEDAAVYAAAGLACVITAARRRGVAAATCLHGSTIAE
jgi:hypothetical protein